MNRLMVTSRRDVRVEIAGWRLRDACRDVTSRRDVRVEIETPIHSGMGVKSHISQRCESRNDRVVDEETEEVIVTSRRDVRVEIGGIGDWFAGGKSHISQRCESRNFQGKIIGRVFARHISQRCESRNWQRRGGKSMEKGHISQRCESRNYISMPYE